MTGFLALEEDETRSLHHGLEAASLFTPIPNLAAFHAGHRRIAGYTPLSESVLWISRPVFITSTFRDMQAERDWLRAHVFPVLEERLRTRLHHLEAIDLRWGVDTASAALQQEHVREMLVLKVCLAEIERSRPFLIGLLGDRYGWRPPEERMKAAVQEAGFDKDVTGKSVTELEILYGVLDSPDQRRRSRFYFRDPLPYDQMPAHLATQYSEKHNSDPDAANAADKLAELKARIKAELPDRTRRYEATCHWDDNRVTVTGLKAWGEQVLEDLWADLEAETAQSVREAPTTWEGQDHWALEEFIEDRVRGFVGRKVITDDLIALALSPAKDGATWSACVTGPPGQGKSSLFGQLYRKLHSDHKDVLVLAHAAGISVRSTQVDRMLQRWVTELAALLGQPNPLDDKASPDDVDAAFARLLHQVSARQRVVVLIDALNQFEQTTRGRYLTWLPKVWPANSRLIATAIPNTQSKALLDRPGAEDKPLSPIDASQAATIIDGICLRYHRTINSQVRNVLLDKKHGDGKPDCGNPLWLELAVEELNLLDADDFARADLEFAAFTFAGERLLRLLLSIVAAMPSDVRGLYGSMLQRAEELFGEAWAQAFVNLIAVSRGGWRETDLRILMPRLSGEPWDDLKFAALRRTFRGHVVQRGGHAQWDFAHAQMRQAVLGRNLADPADGRILHASLAEHLVALPREDPLHETETMVHLMQADDLPRAAAYYGGDLTGGEKDGATAALARMILGNGALDGPAEGTDPLTPILALPKQPVDQARRANLCNRFNFELNDAIENQASLAPRYRLLEVALRSLESLAAADPSNSRCQCDLSVSHIKIGNVLSAQGDPAGALKAYRTSHAIIERLAAADPSNSAWQRELSVSYVNIGDVLSVQGDVAGALKAYRKCQYIFVRLAAADPSNARWRHDLSLSHEKIGDMLSAQGDRAGALKAYSACHAFYLRRAAVDPSNARWQRDLSVNHVNIGDMLSAQGDRAGALKAYSASHAIFERLAAADPSNSACQCDLSVSHIKIGDVLSAQGDPAGALKTYRASLAIDERLAQQDPGNAKWQHGLVIIHSRLAELIAEQGDVACAMEELKAANEIARLASARFPGSLDLQLTVHQTAVIRIRIHLSRHRVRLGVMGAVALLTFGACRLVQFSPWLWFLALPMMFLSFIGVLAILAPVIAKSHLSKRNFRRLDAALKRWQRELNSFDSDGRDANGRSDF